MALDVLQVRMELTEDAVDDAQAKVDKLRYALLIKAFSVCLMSVVVCPCVPRSFLRIEGGINPTPFLRCGDVELS